MPFFIQFHSVSVSDLQPALITSQSTQVSISRYGHFVKCKTWLYFLRKSSKIGKI